MAARRAPLEYNRTWQMRLWLFAVFFFLYAPLVALIIFSFNDSKRNIVWRGFTLNYYKKLFNNEDLMIAFANSLTIALFATLISLVIGALAAVLLWRYRFTGKAAVEGAFTLPLVVPEICMGVAMLLFFTRVIPWPNDLVWPFSLGSIIIAHVSFCFPFVALVVGARLASFNKEQEEAARDLGANDWQAFRETLRDIRKDGYCLTIGEYRRGALGVAAPLFNSAGSVLGSLGIATHATSVKRAEIPALAKSVVKAARDATQRICSGEHGVDLPARALGRADERKARDSV